MDPQYEQIVQAAGKLFQTNGIRNVSVDEVCAELRISKKNILHSPQKLKTKKSFKHFFFGI